MSQWSDIASALATAVAAVSSAGQVHAYQRWNADWSKYLGQFKSTIGGKVQIRGWMLRREAMSAEPGEAFGQIARTHQFVLIGIQGLEDASNTYATFQTLCESVMDALDVKRDFSLSSVLDYSVGPCEIRTFGEEMLGSVLCHVAEIVVPVTTVHAVTYA